MNQANAVYLEAADLLGARLCRDAIWAGDRCNWLGDSMEFVDGTHRVVHRSFGPDLYSGTSGVALLLARLYALTQERLFRVTAEGAMAQALSRLDQFDGPARPGFFGGLTGVVYALNRLASDLDRPDLSERALDLVRDLAREDPDPVCLDVIAGPAGAIPVLLQLYRQHRQDDLLDLAVRYGEHLLQTANKGEAGWSWRTLDMPCRDLTGFAHGAAGIAWALLELHQATSKARFLKAAEQGFRYEQHWFHPQYGNWPDFRGDAETPPGSQATPSYGVAWCHGAPGIGLARLRAYQLTRDPAYLAQAEAALRTTGALLRQSAWGQQGSFSLCHGMAGNAALFVYASQVLESAEHKALAEQVGLQGIERYQKGGLPWPCGVRGGGETPGFMLGLAGIAWFYLRLYDPAETPSVLILV
jgi:type 2 lantibiotic biosynthesis protein LanM